MEEEELLHLVETREARPRAHMTIDRAQANALASGGNDPKTKSSRKTQRHLLSISEPELISKYKIFRPSKELLHGNTNGLESLKELVDHTGGYTSNFGSTKEEGIVLHGEKNGSLGYVNKLGRETFGDPLSVILKLDKDYNLGLRERNSPLHIFACYLSNDETGFHLSNNLGRPIYLYGNGNQLRANGLKLLSGENPGMWNMRQDLTGEQYLGKALPKLYNWEEDIIED